MGSGDKCSWLVWKSNNMRNNSTHTTIFHILLPTNVHVHKNRPHFVSVYSHAHDRHCHSPYLISVLFYLLLLLLCRAVMFCFATAWFVALFCSNGQKKRHPFRPVSRSSSCAKWIVRIREKGAGGGVGVSVAHMVECFWRVDARRSEERAETCSQMGMSNSRAPVCIWLKVIFNSLHSAELMAKHTQTHIAVVRFIEIISGC